MQYNSRDILGMIASAINPDNPFSCYRTECDSDLTGIDITPDRDALSIHMADGRSFRITAEEVGT